MKAEILSSLCKLFDRYEIVETQGQIDKDYYSVNETIFTDGELKTNINGKGYIHIAEVKNATYLIFIDLEHKIYLSIYKYISDNMYKHIKQKLQILKNTLI